MQQGMGVQVIVMVMVWERERGINELRARTGKKNSKKKKKELKTLITTNSKPKT